MKTKLILFFLCRIIDTTTIKTENEELSSEPLIKKRELKSKPLKASNGIARNMTNGNSTRPRGGKAAARSADSHKLTEYFKEEIKSPKSEAPPPSPPLGKNTKTDKLNGNTNTNHKLTEYYPVRRSVRKTSKCVMAEKMRDLEKAIREQREDGLQVKYLFAFLMNF